MNRKVCIKKLNIRLTVTVILAIILSAAVFACPSFGAVYDCYIDVTQTITVKGSYSKPRAEIRYTLESVDGACPMHDGKTGESFTFGIRGEAEKTLKIRYDKPGEYVYSLRQLKPDARGYSHDKTKYTVTVAAEDTSGGAVARVKAIVDSDGYKHSGITFNNKFNPPAGYLETKTGDVSYIWTLIMMSLISGIFFLMLIFCRRGNKNGELVDRI